MPAASPEPTDHLEVETKLEADPEFVIPDLSSAPGLPAGVSVTEPRVLHLRADYFDTADLRLLRSGVTLRRRAGGIDDGWHLKLPAEAGARREVALPLETGAAGHIPDGFARLVVGVARGLPLGPVAKVQTSRTVRRLTSGDGVDLVEIADDVVTADPLLAGGDEALRVPLQLREVEVEVLDGTAAQMTSVVDHLVAAGARPASHGSKLARALGVSAACPVASPAVVAGTDGADGTAGDVIGTALLRYRQQLLAADVAMRWPDPGADALHDARAAARRIRSVLTVYAPLFLRGRTPSLARGLRHIGAQVAATRDLDVVTARILQGPDGTTGEAATLTAHLAILRRAALEDLQAYLVGDEYLDTLRAMDQIVEQPPWTAPGKHPAEEVLRPLLNAAWLRLQSRAEAALGAPDEHDRTHEARKAAKTVRYAAETAAPALGSAAVELAGFAERVQDVLGEHQDAVITIAALSNDAPTAATATASAEAVASWRRVQQQDMARTFRSFADLWSDRPPPVI